MSDTFQYRKEIDLQKIVDEQARELQRRVDEATLDKAADTLADFGYVKADGKNRWFELFGTPRRAARTLSIMQRCELGIIGNCDECEMHDACRVRDGDYDALLGWLRGEGE